MWEKVSIERSQSKLAEAHKQIQSIQKQIQLIEKRNTNLAIHEVLNMAEVSLSIINAARASNSSIGCHYIKQDE